MPQRPAFIAFTGVDLATVIDDLRALSARYPIEWGILIDAAQEALPLFPDAATRQALLTAGGLRFAAHVCGAEARRIANAPDTAIIDLAGFSRLQVNHSFEGSSQAQADNTVRFGRTRGLRAMLQCKGAFPADSRLDWLFDTSFGRGTAPGTWPKLPADGPFCGFAGGINPSTVADVLKAVDAAPGALYWIDMESGVRTDGWLDLDKCESVCKAVFD
ncbi:MAG: hypothetical protein H6Q99_1501 [Proteobacteria bacterium]|nr:hypothetical protein [Pseudomonadota bacterium]